MADRTQDFQQPLGTPDEKHDSGSGDDVSTKADADLVSGAAAGGGNQADPEKKRALGNEDKYEITEDDCYDELGFSFPTWKKWYILTIIFIVQVSMVRTAGKTCRDAGLRTMVMLHMTPWHLGIAPRGGVVGLAKCVAAVCSWSAKTVVRQAVLKSFTLPLSSHRCVLANSLVEL
jgi:hypothetical protein